MVGFRFKCCFWNSSKTCVEWRITATMLGFKEIGRAVIAIL